MAYIGWDARFYSPLYLNGFPDSDGVSYNSFFIDDEKTCVLDAMDKVCRDEFLEDVELFAPWPPA